MADVVPPVVGGVMAAVGDAAAVMGLVTLPLFIASAIIGIINMANSMNERLIHSAQQVIVRVHAGKAAPHMALGGYLPSVGLWDVNGVCMGHDKKHGHHIDQGGSRQMHVMTKANDIPDYIAVVAQKEDAVCVSAIEIHWKTATSVAMILGDTGMICGMPWYHSRQGISDMFDPPRCMWMDGSNLTKSRVAGEEGDDFGGASVWDPPAGIIFHIPAFTGKVAERPEVARQRSNAKELTCGHKARFQVVWDDGIFSGPFHIPIFTDIPFPWLIPNYTDYADPSDNYANFTNLPWRESDPLDGDIKDIAKEAEERNTKEAEEARKKQEGKSLLQRDLDVKDEHILAKRKAMFEWYDTTLIKDEASARDLCESETSWGPDWYSHREDLYCEMLTKTLLHSCKTEDDNDCFDVNTHRIRHKECGQGKLCGRAALLPQKDYKSVEDSRAPQDELKRDVRWFA